ncbi:MAG: hypothetical protein H6926_00090 [Chromatiales bacterium]|nr:hypothetical protein [Gammaproteobacteria bacterium]MCP5230959.1 hypothetical protein [Zoogloeaceae bacterium]MCP5351580.1 hypothetical protein [Chromatiales bacterium]
MPHHRLVTAFIAGSLTFAAPSANAFFCIMMNAMMNGGGGNHFSGHMGARPYFGGAPIAFNGAYPPPFMAMPPPGHGMPAALPPIQPPVQWPMQPRAAAPHTNAKPAIAERAAETE